MAQVLLIDDSAFTRKMMKNILEPAGHTVVEASSGEESLKKYMEDKFDCIFLDLLMPDMSGFEVLEELRKLHNEVPVIVLTADVQETSKEKCLQLGASEFTNKPLNKDKDHIIQLVEKYSSQG